MTTIKQTTGKPRRLPFVFQDYLTPMYFVTLCVADRVKALACDALHEALKQNALQAGASGCVVGRYVVMPDHIHLFVSIGGTARLGDYIRFLKRDLRHACLMCSGRSVNAPSLLCSGRSVNAPSSSCAGKNWSWQRGFFDHLVRHAESYSEKWTYVRENPVRAGLVLRPDEWPYQGEIAEFKGSWQS